MIFRSLTRRREIGANSYLVPETQGLTARNYANARRFLDQMREVGVI